MIKLSIYMLEIINNCNKNLLKMVKKLIYNYGR